MDHKPATWQVERSLPLFLATRFLRGSRREAYVRFLSTLAIGGIWLGVAALILVLAGLSGLQHFLRADVLARTPQIEIELAPRVDAQPTLDSLGRVEGVVEARLLLRGRGWLVAGGSAVNAEMIGFTGKLPSFFAQDTDQRTALLSSGLVIGDGLALRFGLEAGDLVEVVSPRPTLTPLGPQPRFHHLRVAGTFSSGRTEGQDHRLALPFETARKLFGERDRRIEVRTTDLEMATQLAPLLEGKLPEGSRLRTWEDLNRGLFFALKLEKMLMFVAVFLIVPVAAMALITVLALLISSKRQEIGMLQALGAPARLVERAFLVLGLALSGRGLVGGVSCGVGLAWLCDRFRLIRPPGDVYYLEYIPFRLEWGDLLLVIGCTLALCLGSTYFAARRAAATGPVEALAKP